MLAGVEAGRQTDLDALSSSSRLDRDARTRSRPPQNTRPESQTIIFWYCELFAFFGQHFCHIHFVVAVENATPCIVSNEQWSFSHLVSSVNKSPTKGFSGGLAPVVGTCHNII